MKSFTEFNKEAEKITENLRFEDSVKLESDLSSLLEIYQEYYDNLETADMEKLRTIFKEEYPKAEKFYRKNKKLMFKIRKLEVTNQIKIPHEISIEEFNNYLKQWSRKEITVNS